MAPKIDNSILDYYADLTPKVSNSPFSFGGMLDKVGSDGKGGQIKTQGWGSLGLGAFNAYNSWSQGNKMHDLGEKALEHEVEQSWINNLMKRDAYNMERNRRTGLVAQAKGLANGAEQTLAGDAAIAEQYNTGEYLQNIDGSQTNVFTAPAEHAGYQQVGPVNPTPIPANGPVRNAPNPALTGSAEAWKYAGTPATNARPATQGVAGNRQQQGTPAAGAAKVGPAGTAAARYKRI